MTQTQTQTQTQTEDRQTEGPPMDPMRPPLASLPTTSAARARTQTNEGTTSDVPTRRRFRNRRAIYY